MKNICHTKESRNGDPEGGFCYSDLLLIPRGGVVIHELLGRRPVLGQKVAGLPCSSHRLLQGSDVATIRERVKKIAALETTEWQEREADLDRCMYEPHI